MMSRRNAASWVLGLLMLSVASAAPAADLGEGTDLEMGGPGRGRGTFQDVRDILFDARNHLYVLDGVRWERGAPVGNGLVQTFDGTGKFLSQFSVLDRTLAERGEPARLAVDGKGRVYVSFPRAGLVRVFDAGGKRLRDHAIAAAHALTMRTLKGREQ